MKPSICPLEFDWQERLTTEALDPIDAENFCNQQSKSLPGIVLNTIQID